VIEVLLRRSSFVSHTLSRAPGSSRTSSSFSEASGSWGLIQVSILPLCNAEENGCYAPYRSFTSFFGICPERVGTEPAPHFSFTLFFGDRCRFFPLSATLPLDPPAWRSASIGQLCV